MIRYFSKTAVLLFALLFSLVAQAKLIAVVNDGKTARSFPDQVATIVDGDDVRITDKNGVVHEFKHLSFIKAGEVGAVYKATNSKGETVVVKFPTTNRKSLSYTRSEVNALRTIKNRHLPVVEVLNYEPGFFVEKDYVIGGTLTDANNDWLTYTSEERSERVVGLLKFIKILRNAPIRISDLHSGNIIWDDHLKMWKVLDPGEVLTATKKSSLEKPRFVANIEELGRPEIKEAIHFALSFPEWTERYIRLRDAVSRLRSVHDIHDYYQFLSQTSEPADNSPRSYMDLWREGFQRIGYLHETAENSPATHCVSQALHTE